jgi:hypothetical protein
MWKDDMVHLADGLFQILESFLFYFLLELYYKFWKSPHFVNFLKHDFRNETCYVAAENRVGAPTRRLVKITNY